MNEELEQLHDRLRTVIQQTCNKIGCKDCDLQWPGGCQALYLQSRIDDLEQPAPTGAQPATELL